MTKISSITLLLLLALFSPTCSYSSHNHTFVTTNDPRFIIGPMDGPYGFRPGGHFQLTVSNFKLHTHSHRHTNVTQSPIEGIHAGFVVKRFDSESEFARHVDGIYQHPSFCLFDDYIDRTSDNDNELSNHTSDGLFLSMSNSSTHTLNHTFTTTDPGLYFLLYQTCLTTTRLSDSVPPHFYSSFTIDLQRTNINIFGNISYLTAGELLLPHMFGYFAVSYLVLWMAWVKLLMQQKGTQVVAIHYLMALMVAMKFLTILCESVKYHYVGVYGVGGVWSVLYYGISLIKGCFLFPVILLIGSGWSFLKPCLTQREKLLMFVVLGLQILVNIALLMLSQETQGEQRYEHWNVLLHLCDVLCCCAVLLPVVWQVRSLNTKIEETDEKSSSDTVVSNRILSRLRLFRSFYIVVISYIYFTRFAVYILSFSLDYTHTWLHYFLVELVTMVFYVLVGIKFRPQEEDPLYHLPLHEEEELEFIGLTKNKGLSGSGGDCGTDIEPCHSFVRGTSFEPKLKE